MPEETKYIITESQINEIANDLNLRNYLNVKYLLKSLPLYSSNEKEPTKLKEIKMTYIEINPTAWTYDKDGDFIEGNLVATQDNVGVNKSMLYSIKTPEGVVKSVWGSAILDSRMALVSIGEKVKITFKGKAEAKKGKNSAKLFKVEVEKVE